ncbi:MAG: hypothetical protein ACKVP2_00075 [Burkholderiales bacterium]
MPALRITKNESLLCTIGSDDVWMYSVSVWFDLWGPAVSTLDISGGGKRRPDGGADILVWEIPQVLSVGDRLAFSFESATVSNPKGKVFKNDSPAATEEEDLESEAVSEDEDLHELESRPIKNSGITWMCSLDGRAGIKVGPNPVRPHVGLLLLWNEDSPERMRVSLSRSSLREIATRSGGESTLLEYVPVGSRLDLVIGG